MEARRADRVAGEKSAAALLEAERLSRANSPTGRRVAALPAAELPAETLRDAELPAATLRDAELPAATLPDTAPLDPVEAERMDARAAYISQNSLQADGDATPVLADGALAGACAEGSAPALCAMAAIAAVATYGAIGDVSLDGVGEDFLPTEPYVDDTVPSQSVSLSLAPSLVQSPRPNPPPMHPALSPVQSPVLLRHLGSSPATQSSPGSSLGQSEMLASSPASPGSSLGQSEMWAGSPVAGIIMKFKNKTTSVKS